MNGDKNIKNGEVLVSTYCILFGELDSNGFVVNKGSINIDNFEKIKSKGEIVDYEVDDVGVKIFRKFNYIMDGGLIKQSHVKDFQDTVIYQCKDIPDKSGCKV